MTLHLPFRSAALAAAGLLFTAAPAPAQEAADAAGSVPAAAASTYWELFQYGREINLFLAVLAFFSLFLFFHLLLVTRRRLAAPEKLLQLLLDDMASGEIETACRRVGEDQSLLARLLRPVLQLHDHPPERLAQVAEGAGRRAMGVLRQRAAYLANIGVLAPMVGLLGTVLGMMTAFETFGVQLDVSLKQKMLTAAIGKAMTTTAAGLLVGIPSMAFHYYASGRLNRLADELEFATEQALACLHEVSRPHDK